MAKRAHRNWRELGNQVISENDFRKMLDVLLPLDRKVLEMSMRLYKIPHRERFLMRKQNRRLHDAVREHLPRLAATSRTPVP